jgi:hypothetical protein
MGALLPWVVLGAMSLLLQLAQWAATRAGYLPPENESVPVSYPADELQSAATEGERCA